MCEFKYCRGTGKCFLSKTSPCSGFDKKSDAPKPEKKSRPRSVRTSYAGFLDHDELIDILEMADDPKPAEPRRARGLFARAPRFLRKAQSAVNSGGRSVA